MSSNIPEIKGAFYCSVKLQRSQSGLFFFKSNEENFDKKVCSISFASLGIIASGVAQEGNKLARLSDALFLNLFDSQGSQFVFDLPAYLCGPEGFGKPIMFRPRKLNYSKCYLRAYDVFGDPFESLEFIVTAFHV